MLDAKFVTHTRTEEDSLRYYIGCVRMIKNVEDLFINQKRNQFHIKVVSCGAFGNSNYQCFLSQKCNKNIHFLLVDI